jgi:electron transfer flavoprotein beta subunit
VSTLRVAVGFKVTPDFEALRPTDWVRLASAEGPQGRAEAARYVHRVLGVFDEAALELALRLRDARAERGLQTSLAAFTVGGREAEPFNATLQALGFACARVDPAGAAGPVDLDFAPAATAALVAACARRLRGDVLMLGERGGPGGSGTVPFLAAEALGRPCVASVTEVEPARDERLRVTWADGRRLLRATLRRPCVLAVGNAVVSMLRVPTLKERLAARGHTAEVLVPAELGVDLGAALSREPSALEGLATVLRQRGGRRIEGASAQDKARALYESELRPRLERLQS